MRRFWCRVGVDTFNDGKGSEVLDEDDGCSCAEEKGMLDAGG